MPPPQRPYHFPSPDAPQSKLGVTRPLCTSLKICVLSPAPRLPSALFDKMSCLALVYNRMIFHLIFSDFLCEPVGSSPTCEISEYIPYVLYLTILYILYLKKKPLRHILGRHLALHQAFNSKQNRCGSRPASLWSLFLSSPLYAGWVWAWGWVWGLLYFVFWAEVAVLNCR